MSDFHCCGNHYSKSEVWLWLLLFLILNGFSKPASSSPAVTWSSIHSQLNLLEIFLSLDCICLIYPMPQTYCFAYYSLNCFCFFPSCVSACGASVSWTIAVAHRWLSQALPLELISELTPAGNTFPILLLVLRTLPEHPSWFVTLPYNYLYLSGLELQISKTISWGSGERGLFTGNSAVCLPPFNCLLDASSFFSFPLWGLPILLFSPLSSMFP